MSHGKNIPLLALFHCFIFQLLVRSSAFLGDFSATVLNMINFSRRKVLQGAGQSPRTEVTDIFYFTDRKDGRNGERSDQTSWGSTKG